MRLWYVGLVWALVSVAVSAQTYDVEIRPTLTDVDIKIDHIESTGVLTVNLTNVGDVRARCKLAFDAQPQAPYRTTVFVDPGETRPTVFAAKRKWFNVTVDVKCEPDRK
jgi:hypothetical protein